MGFASWLLYVLLFLHAYGILYWRIYVLHSATVTVKQSYLE